MNLIALSIAVLGMAAAPAMAAKKKARLAPPDMQALTPGLADYTDDVLFGDVWKRAGLSPRDRSVVTVSALIAGGKMAQLTGHTNRALDNGGSPARSPRSSRIWPSTPAGRTWSPPSASSRTCSKSAASKQQT